MAINDEKARNTQRVQGVGYQRQGGSARAGYQAANIETKQVRRPVNWAGFISAVSNLHGAYEQDAKNTGRKRAMQIVNELSPAERRKAIEDGVLLYQDDEYAMSSLYQLVGQQEAQASDLHIQRKTKNGDFRSRAELEKYRAEYNEQNQKNIAESLGISTTNEDFLDGFIGDSDRRQVAMLETFDQMESARLQTVAFDLNNKTVNQILEDPQLRNNPEVSRGLAAKQQQDYEKGLFATPTAYRASIKQTATSMATFPSNTEGLQSYGMSTVNIDGEDIRIMDLYSPDEWTNLVSKSETNTVNNNTALKSQYTQQSTQFQLALNRGDFEEARKLRDIINETITTAMPSDISNEYKEGLARNDQLLALAEGAQADKNAQLAYVAQLEQEDLDTWLSNFAEVERTGLGSLEVGDIGGLHNVTGVSDIIQTGSGTYTTKPEARGKTNPELEKRGISTLFGNIDTAVEGGQLTEAEGLAQKLRVTALFPEDSFATQLFKQNTTRANREFNAAVNLTAADIKEAEASGEQPFRTLRSLQDTYTENPLQYATIDPEGASRYAAIGYLNDIGVDGLEMILQSERAQKDKQPEQQQEERAVFDEMWRSSNLDELAQGDKRIIDSVFTLYQAQLNEGNNPTQALDTVNAFMETQTAPIGGGDASSGIRARNISGRIPNATLTLSKKNPEASLKEGVRMTEETLERIKVQHPELNNNQWKTRSQGDTVIYTYSLDPSIQYRMPIGSFRAKYHEDEQARLEQKKLKDEAERDRLFNPQLSPYFRNMVDKKEDTQQQIPKYEQRKTDYEKRKNKSK